jgi:hypothetical protein
MNMRGRIEELQDAALQDAAREDAAREDAAPSLEPLTARTWQQVRMDTLVESAAVDR